MITYFRKKELPSIRDLTIQVLNPISELHQPSRVMFFWILVIGSVGLAWLAAIGLGFLPPPHASTLVYVRNGSLEVRRGRLKPHAREHVMDILQEARVSGGYIAITSDSRVYFSNRIPAAVHQRLRKVLLNQWA